MTDRDRLVELLKDTLHEWECDVSIKTVTEIAEHLISNGVIVLPYKDTKLMTPEKAIEELELDAIHDLQAENEALNEKLINVLYWE